MIQTSLVWLQVRSLWFWRSKDDFLDAVPWVTAILVSGSRHKHASEVFGVHHASEQQSGENLAKETDVSSSSQDDVCKIILKTAVSLTAELWQRTVRRQIMNVERLSLCLVRWPEAQRNVDLLLRDWAPVCGGEEWLALFQTWDLLGLQAHAQASVFESSPCFNSMTISRVVTSGSLQFASRTEKLLQVYWPFYSEPAFTSPSETAVSPRGACRL